MGYIKLHKNEVCKFARYSIAAWYMTKDNEKMLVLHNFGNASVELSLTDNIEKTVGVSGTVQVKDGDDTSIRLGGYSSVVYKIAQ